MRLDHLRSVGPPYFVNQVVQRHLSWSNRTQVVQAGRPRHGMRDAVPPCGTCRRGGAPEPPPPHPVRPRRPAHRSRRARLPPARPEATRAGHHDRPRAPAPLTTPRITPGERTQNHSPNSPHNIASWKCDRTSAEQPSRYEGKREFEPGRPGDPRPVRRARGARVEIGRGPDRDPPSSPEGSAGGVCAGVAGMGRFRRCVGLGEHRRRRPGRG